jgi:uncharacterized DUF497 family protein
MNFDWDENKNEENIRKHGFDFQDAWEVFDQFALLKPSLQSGERRYLCFGELDDVLVAIVFTYRDDTIRIISFRKARKSERRDYKEEIEDRLGANQGND